MQKTCLLSSTNKNNFNFGLSNLVPCYQASLLFAVRTRVAVVADSLLLRGLLQRQFFYVAVHGKIKATQIWPGTPRAIYSIVAPSHAWNRTCQIEWAYRAHAFAFLLRAFSAWPVLTSFRSGLLNGSRPSFLRSRALALSLV